MPLMSKSSSKLHKMNNRLKALIALSPVAVLLAVYLLASILAGDFYKIPISVAFVVAAVYGAFLLKGMKLKERIKVFSTGAANPDIMYMIWIFCFAGIFASTAKAMGAVDVTVALTLKAVPAQFLPAGLFVAACFISMAIGTSVGTIVALAPMVNGLAVQLGSEQGWLLAIIVGGAFFGDNLSFISDTTIAATQTQNCRMSDKFKANFLIVLPAALAALCIYLFNSDLSAPVLSQTTVEWYKALPYLLVIVLALLGMNVLAVLLCGIVLTCLMGIICGSFDLVTVFTAAGEGMQSMTELILVTLLASGLMNIVKTAGGFDLLIKGLTARISSRKGAEAVIALLTALTNVCTANNTIAILTTGPIARDLSQKFGVEPRKAASLMDTASCFVQGMLPYGAQILMASGIAGINPLAIIPHLYYPMLIGLMVVLSILFGFPRLKKV